MAEGGQFSRNLHITVEIAKKEIKSMDDVTTVTEAADDLMNVAHSPVTESVSKFSSPIAMAIETQEAVNDYSKKDYSGAIFKSTEVIGGFVAAACFGPAGLAFWGVECIIANYAIDQVNDTK